MSEIAEVCFSQTLAILFSSFAWNLAAVRIIGVSAVRELTVSGGLRDNWIIGTLRSNDATATKKSLKK